MKKTGTGKLFQYLLVTVFTLAAFGAVTPEKCQADEVITANISPNIINLDSVDHTFGIHAGIPYSVVDTDTVLLICPDDTELVPIVCYADSRGYLVAKFSTADLTAYCDLDIGADNTLVLEGQTLLEPEFFTGGGEVLIMESQPQFQKGNGPKLNPNKNCKNR